MPEYLGMVSAATAAVTECFQSASQRRVSQLEVRIDVFARKTLLMFADGPQ